MTTELKIPGAVIPLRVFTQPGSQPEVAHFGLMSAHTSCGLHAANAYRRLVPLPDSCTAAKQSLYSAALMPSTILGSRIVKVEPRPGSLSTVISPPIIWQKRLLIASPRPVPPYLQVVEASA